MIDEEEMQKIERVMVDFDYRKEFERFAEEDSDQHEEHHLNENLSDIRR